MAKGFTNKLNPIQAERSGLTNQDVDNAFHDMASKGEMPEGRTYIMEDSTDENGLHTIVYFNRENQKWISQSDIRGEVQNRFEADTQEELRDAIVAYNKQFDAEHSPMYLLGQKWMRDSKWGRMFATFQCPNAWKTLQRFVPADNISIATLDASFIKILDTVDPMKNWSRFEEWRDAKARAAAAEAARPASTPHVNLSEVSQARKAEDNANKELPISELRRRALFGGRTKTTPMTGTVLRTK